MSSKGYKHSEEAKEKIRESKLGDKNHAKRSEVRKRISDTLKGNIISEETRKKISIANKGLKRSTEYCKQFSKNQTGSKNPNWKGGVSYRQGYKFILNRDHPYSTKRGYIAEHRLVAERCLNRYLTKKEQIHHINKIRDDNRPENLYLFPSKKEHQIFHRLKNNPNLVSNLNS